MRTVQRGENGGAIETLAGVVADAIQYRADGEDYDAPEAERLADTAGVVLGACWGPDDAFANLYRGEALDDLARGLGADLPAGATEQQKRAAIVAVPKPARDDIPIELLAMAAADA